MPSASEDLRDKMLARFGDRIDEAGPIRFLKDAGYVLTKNWFWHPKPGVAGYRDMTQPEFDCIMFLMNEWDFGGLTTED